MKFLSIILSLLLFCGTATFAAENTVQPDQEIDNTKTFFGANYERQDTKETGKQKISNNRSFFNINIIIVKEGKLFDKKAE